MTMMGGEGEQEMKKLGWEIEKERQGIRCSFRGELSRILGFEHPPPSPLLSKKGRKERG